MECVLKRIGKESTMFSHHKVSIPAKVLMYLMVVFVVGIIPAPSCLPRCVSIGQEFFHSCGGWTWWITAGSLLWFLLPPLFFVKRCRERRQTMAWGKRLFYSIVWSLLCTASKPVEVTLFYAVLWFGYVSALLFLPLIYCGKEVTP